MFFSKTRWPQLLAPFYAMLFATSFCQDNSSESSPIMPDEFGEHLTRDQRPFLHTESLQILQIPSSMLVVLLFSSLHSFSLGFRSGNWDGHGRSFILCSETHFCVGFDVCFGSLSWWKTHYWISSRSGQVLIFYLLVFDRIHDTMYLNKMSTTSSRKIGPQH